MALVQGFKIRMLRLRQVGRSLKLAVYCLRFQTASGLSCLLVRSLTLPVQRLAAIDLGVACLTEDLP
jgi:hypothetical protein